MNNSAKTVTRMGLFCVVLILCSWCTLPFAIPFTLQLVGVFLCVGVLGGAQALGCILVYLALGCLGLPVFAGFSGGIGVLLGPTGGFLLGFVPLCLVCGWLYPKAKKLWSKGLVFGAGLAVDYLVGTLWYCLVFTRGQASFLPAVAVCVLPFVLPDILKIVASVYVLGHWKRGKLW